MCNTYTIKYKYYKYAYCMGKRKRNGLWALNRAVFVRAPTCFAFTTTKNLHLLLWTYKVESVGMVPSTSLYYRIFYSI